MGTDRLIRFFLNELRLKNKTKKNSIINVLFIAASRGAVCQYTYVIATSAGFKANIRL